MAMQPEVLILDEPTSQLDPVAASEFLSCLHRINRELGVTVVLCEQRLEEVSRSATRCCCLIKAQYSLRAPRGKSINPCSNLTNTHGR